MEVHLGLLDLKEGWGRVILFLPSFCFSRGGFGSID